MGSNICALRLLPDGTKSIVNLPKVRECEYLNHMGRIYMVWSWGKGEPNELGKKGGVYITGCKDGEPASLTEKEMSFLNDYL